MDELQPHQLEDDLDLEQPRRPILRALYIGVVIFVILILLLQTTGISYWLLSRRLSGVSLIGQTESEVIERLGSPDHRSATRAFESDAWPPFSPQTLRQNDPSYALIYKIGGRTHIIFLVSPGLFELRHGSTVIGSEWVVIEHVVVANSPIF